MKEQRFHVYVIEAVGADMFKIGFARRLKNRLSNLQCASPYELKIRYAIKTKYPKKLEHYLHVRFSEKRHRGEWFKLSQEDIKTLKTIATGRISGELTVRQHKRQPPNIMPIGRLRKVGLDICRGCLTEGLLYGKASLCAYCSSDPCNPAR